jgi:hypothetical protein
VPHTLWWYLKSCHHRGVKHRSRHRTNHTTHKPITLLVILCRRSDGCDLWWTSLVQSLGCDWIVSYVVSVESACLVSVIESMGWIEGGHRVVEGGLSWRRS